MQWLNEPASWQRVGDELTVTVDPDTDFWRETGYGYVHDNGHVYGEVLPGDLDVLVTIRGNFATQYDQAGIMLRADERTWLKTGVEFFEGRPRLSTVLTLGQSSWIVADLPGWPDEITLRAARRGDAVEVRYAAGEGELELAALVFMPADVELMAGVMCAAPEGLGFRVTFSGLTITDRAWVDVTDEEMAAWADAQPSEDWPATTAEPVGTEPPVPATAEYATATTDGAEPAEPAGIEPAGIEPTDTEPADTEPADPEPADPESADPELGDSEPGDSELGDTEPADTQPADPELGDTDPRTTPFVAAAPLAPESPVTQPVEHAEPTAPDEPVDSSSDDGGDGEDGWAGGDGEDGQETSAPELPHGGEAADGASLPRGAGEDTVPGHATPAMPGQATPATAGGPAPVAPPSTAPGPDPSADWERLAVRVRARRWAVPDSDDNLSDSWPGPPLVVQAGDTQLPDTGAPDAVGLDTGAGEPEAGVAVTGGISGPGQLTGGAGGLAGGGGNTEPDLPVTRAGTPPGHSEPPAGSEPPADSEPAGSEPPAGSDPPPAKGLRRLSLKPRIELPAPQDPADEWISLLTADPADE